MFLFYLIYFLSVKVILTCINSALKRWWFSLYIQSPFYMSFSSSWFIARLFMALRVPKKPSCEISEIASQFQIIERSYCFQFLRQFWDLVIHVDIIIRFIDYTEQNGYLKIFIGWLWGKMSVGGGLAAL